MKLKTSILSLTLMSVLLLGTFALPVYANHGNETPGIGSGPATSSGQAASLFLSPGPISTSPFSGSGGGASPSSPSVPSGADTLTPKPLSEGPSHSKSPTTVPPVVNCNSSNSGCDTISNNAGGSKTNPLALSSLSLYAFYVEPPDQGLCAGNGYVMELVNQGQMQVFNTNLQAVSSPVLLDDLMGLTGLGWSSGGDVMCTFDVSNGGHWIITQFVSATSEGVGGPFGGCFVGVPDTCLEGIAVSTTSDPMGSYNVYFFNPNAVNNDPGASQGTLLNDYVKIATTRDALLMFYDEFNLGNLPSGSCPGTFGCGGFNGAQELAFNKNALEKGLPTTSPYFTYAYENMGTAPNLYPIPANGAFQPIAASCATGVLAGAVCWYQVIPAQSAGPSQWDNSHGGTGYMVGSLDFFGAGDNRMAVFDWTGLGSLNSANCNSCHEISFSGQLLTGLQTYQNEGSLGAQKAGPTPLGDYCNELLSSSFTDPCPEGGIATNGDGVTQAYSTGGQVWVSVSTLVTQNFRHAASETHIGAAYWVISSSGNGFFGDSSNSFSVSNQGYVTAAHEDLEFPTIASGGYGSAVMSFTLSGNGGPTGADNGGFYPSSAFVRLSSFSFGFEGAFFGGQVIHIAALGQGPQDGFSEYLGPRWGDYGAAVFDPSTGKIFFGTEYIQYPNCSPTAFANDPSCGGTRTIFTNWGTSISSVST